LTLHNCCILLWWAFEGFLSGMIAESHSALDVPWCSAVRAGEDGVGWKELASWGTVVSTCRVKHRNRLTNAEWEVRLL
jgi:hypothetical protein